MTAPKRWLEDPNADDDLNALLRGASRARGLDEMTKRRLSVKVARASALPAVAAGWLFVKSAAAALGVVVGTASVATYTGVIDWPARTPAAAPSAKPKPTPRLAAPVVVPAPVVEAIPLLNPVPALPVTPSSSTTPTPSSSGASLAAEAQLLEQARRELRRAPAVALHIAGEHDQRFPRAQLASERTLIRIEALHRLGREVEARELARSILSGASGGLYAERVRQLLGDVEAP